MIPHVKETNIKWKTSGKVIFVIFSPKIHRLFF